MDEWAEHLATLERHNDNRDTLNPLVAVKYDPEYRRRFLSKLASDRKVLRKEIIFAYGSKCSCCKETAEEFLTVDHVYRDGKKDRNLKFYKSLKANGFPKDRYRLLCMNCNWAIRFGRKCPHAL